MTTDITTALAQADAIFNEPHGKASPSLERELQALYVMARAILVAVQELQEREAKA